MKTLKQILFKYHRETYNQNFITESVKEWLTQKRQESPCKKCISKDICQRPQDHVLESGFYGCLDTEETKKHNQAINELLEELNQ